MAADCLFCRIVAGEIPADIVHRDESSLAFRDIAPKAPTHILVIPIHHLASVADLTDDDAGLSGHLLAVTADLARREGIDGSGYRVVTNVGDDAGQSVHHLHLHLLGGRGLGWPPG